MEWTDSIRTHADVMQYLITNLTAPTAGEPFLWYTGSGVLHTITKAADNYTFHIGDRVYCEHRDLGGLLAGVADRYLQDFV